METPHPTAPAAPLRFRALPREVRDEAWKALLAAVEARKLTDGNTRAAFAIGWLDGAEMGERSLSDLLNDPNRRDMITPGERDAYLNGTADGAARDTFRLFGALRREPKPEPEPYRAPSTPNDAADSDPWAYEESDA